MCVLKSVLVLLSIFGGAHFASGFKPNVSPLKDAQVLVIGASGRVGGEVVTRLSKQGYKVRAMVRDPNTFFPLKRDLGTGPVEIVVGDVLDRSSLDSALEGCTSCIDCHGLGRPISLSDLWTHPSKDPERRHPYFVNYLGVKNLVDSALAAGCDRVVRMTGLSVGLSAFHPLAFMLNLCLSMTIMWQWEAEKVLREAADKGLDYTVVRPGALTDIPRPKEVSLVLGSDGKPPSMFSSVSFYRIGRRDVADLLVATMAETNTRRATLSCAWGKDPQGPKTWKNLLAKVKPDSSPLPLRLYRQATVLLGAMVTAATVAIILKISHIRYSFITQKKQKGFLV